MAANHKQGQHTRTQERWALFKARWLTNGHNATKAAIAAGYSPRTANRIGHRLLKQLRESGEIADIAQAVAVAAELETVRTLREVARIAYNDPRRIFYPDGSLIPLHELPDDVAATIASVEMGADGKPKKVKFWSKTDALDKAMRHAGLFERDNRQKQENLAIQINLVGADPTSGRAGAVNVRANLIEGRKA